MREPVADSVRAVADDDARGDADATEQGCAGLYPEADGLGTRNIAALVIIAPLASP